MVRKPPTMQQRFSRARGLEAGLYSIDHSAWPPGTDIVAYRADLLAESGVADGVFMRGVARTLFDVNPNILRKTIAIVEEKYATATETLREAGSKIIIREQQRVDNIDEITRSNPSVQTLGDLWIAQGFKGGRTADRAYSNEQIPGSITVNGSEQTVRGTVEEAGFSYAIAPGVPAFGYPIEADELRIRFLSQNDAEHFVRPQSLPTDRLLEMADVVVAQLDGANPVLRR